MSHAVELSVVLPSYKEAEALSLLLPVLKEHLAKLTSSSEILVVDALEKVDDTPGVCAIQGVRHVFRSGGNTYGDAVRTGIAEARGEFILVMDADGSHNPAHMQRLWEH